MHVLQSLVAVVLATAVVATPLPAGSEERTLAKRVICCYQAGTGSVRYLITSANCAWPE